jgi:hypothetical protein
MVSAVLLTPCVSVSEVAAIGLSPPPPPRASAGEVPRVELHLTS